MNRSLPSRKLLALSTLTLLLSSPAWSQGMAHPEGPYIGLSVGQSRGSLNERSLALRQLTNSGPIAISGLTNDSRDTAYRGFLGYQYSRMLAIEAGYFDLGRFSLQANTQPLGQLNGSQRTQGGSLELVATVPISDRLDFLVRGGGQYARTRSNFDGSGAVIANNREPSAKRWNYKAGLGMQFAFTPGFLMRVEAEQLRVPNPTDGQMRVRVYSVSAVFPFGSPAAAPRAAAQPAVYRPVVAEAPVAPPPPPPVMAPAPRPAPMPAPVVELRRVSFNAESLFGFDQTGIRPEGKQALDGLANELKGTEFSVVAVEGHADRLGKDSYNLALSQRRADAVKNYLVSPGGVMASKITSTGLGETVPVTQPGDCKASLGTMALRACLQPDRRVDVVVNGTR
jgi:OmpA-OmpF porin, OOP family